MARWLLGAVVGALVTAGGMSVATAADNRTLDLYNTHTKERLTITFKKNGKFVASSLKELNRFLRDWRRNEPTDMDPRLFDTVWEVYSRSGSRQPIHVVSAYRSPATNNMLRSRSRAVAKHSQHTLGKAMDFFLPDVRVSKIREIGVGMQRGGVGFYPTANNPFVHLDVGSVRAWPRMSRDQLARIFPDGKTVHLPADGKPLAGYEQALAELKRNGTAARPLAIADDAAAKKKKGGLFAILFGDEEDETEELNAASTTGQVLTAAAPPPAAAKEPAPPPVVVAAPTPPKAPERAEPTVTSLAEATLPPGLAPIAEPAPAPIVVAAAPPPPAPRKRPADLAVAAVEFAAVDPSALPRPRPEFAVAEDAPIQVASADPAGPILPTSAFAAPGEPADARMALAEVARDPYAGATDNALGYASATAPSPPLEQRPRVRTASLTQGGSLRDADTGGRGVPSEAGMLAKADPLATFSKVEPPTDLPVYDGSVTTYRGAFAKMAHPNQRSRDLLFTTPTVVVQAAFDRRPYGAMSSQGFAGVSLTRLPVMTFRGTQDFAAR
ncbi:MAG TPA: DUF882 domain-containing protein [Methylomirabilota bacterium]|nr:DUF882 domain-containing protein [Methylomirabilota bacterium]